MTGAGAMTVNLTLTPEQIRAALPRCEGCRYWERLERDPDALGACSLLSRKGGTVSTFLEREGEARLLTSRHFGCVLWQGRE